MLKIFCSHLEVAAIGFDKIVFKVSLPSSDMGPQIFVYCLLFRHT